MQNVPFAAPDRYNFEGPLLANPFNGLVQASAGEIGCEESATVVRHHGEEIHTAGDVVPPVVGHRTVENEVLRTKLVCLADSTHPTNTNYSLSDAISYQYSSPVSARTAHGVCLLL